MRNALRILLTLLLCTIVILCLSAESFADDGTWGDLTWTLDDAGTLTISGTGEMDDFLTLIQQTPGDLIRTP